MEAPLIVQDRVQRLPGARVKWHGVVMIERPSQYPFVTESCKVRSARTAEFGGFRAIVCVLPYGAVKKYFGSKDGLDVCVYAKLYDGEPSHLQLYERASKREFFLTAGPSGADNKLLNVPNIRRH